MHIANFLGKKIMNNEEWIFIYHRLQSLCLDSATGVDRHKPYYSSSQLLARIAKEKATHDFYEHLKTAPSDVFNSRQDDKPTS